MSCVVALAGMRGAGKSFTADKYQSVAVVLHIEPIQAQVAGDALDTQPNVALLTFKVWNEQLRARFPDLLPQAFAKIHPELEASDLPVIIEGAILVQDWFFAGIIDWLRTRFPHQCQSVHRFLLDLPSELIASQIQARKNSFESSYFGNQEKVDKEKRGYDRMAGKQWVRVASHEEFSRRLQGLLPNGDR